MTITLYSQAACGPCVYTEQWLKKNVEAYDKVRIDQDSDAMSFIQSLGHQRTPVVVLADGDKVIDHFSGFSEARLKEIAKSQ